MRQPSTPVATCSMIAAALLPLGCGGSAFVNPGIEEELAEEPGPAGKGAVGAVLRDIARLPTRPNDRLANSIFRKSFAMLAELKTEDDARNRRGPGTLCMSLWFLETNCGVKALIRGSRSGHPVVRRLAAAMLAWSGSRKAMPRLRELLDTPAEGVDEQLIPVFFPVLEDAGQEAGARSARDMFALAIRKEVIGRLARSRASEAAVPLTDRFPVADDYEKTRLLLAFGKIKADAPVPLIAPLLKDERHKFAALDALAKIGTERAERALLDAFDKNILRDEVAFRLAGMGTVISAPALERALKETERHNVRAAIIRALHRIRGEATVVDGLLRQLASGGRRREVVLALGRAGDRRAVEPIRDLLTELCRTHKSELGNRDHGAEIAACARALANLGDKDAIPAIRGVLSLTSSVVRRDLALALRELTGEDFKYACVHDLPYR